MIKVYLKGVDAPKEYEKADRVQHGEQFTILVDVNGNYIASFPNERIRQIDTTDN